MIRRSFNVAMLVAGVAALAAGGCGGAPSQVNVELRKDNDHLHDQITQLQRQHEADQATIIGLTGTPATKPMLSPAQLSELFTASGLQLGRLTGGFHLEDQGPSDTMVRVFAVPIDEQGQALKVAGSFRIQLFDLALSHPELGQWDFDLEQARDCWYGEALLYTYVLDCPWQVKPIHSNLTVRVTFTDALTGRVFTVQKQISVVQPG